MKLKEILDKTTAFFRDKQIESPRLDAELLLAHGLKLERIQLYLRFDQPMTEEELTVLRDLVRRRASGEPVAYILGYRDFYAHRFEVNSSVLIPRPETEHIIEEAIAWAIDKKDNPFGILDLGAGSGCVGLSLLKAFPNARLISVDISEKALEVAKRNAVTLEVAERVRFYQGDASQVDSILPIYKEFTNSDKIDFLVSNPPYIAVDDPQVEKNVKKFEPSLALYAEDNGLALLKEWSKLYGPHINSPGIMLMEMGMSQGSVLTEHLKGLKIFNEISIIKDLADHDRVIRGVKNG